MQILNRVQIPLKWLVKTLILALITTGIIFAATQKSYAQYNQDAYGQCAYGEACPTTPNNPDPPTDTPDNPEVDNPNTDDTDPEDPSDTPTNNPGTIEQPSDDDTNNSLRSGGFRQTTNPNQPVEPVKGLAALNPLVNLINKLPEAQKRQLPFYSWLLLALLALILLLQAMLDRHKIKIILALVKKLQTKLREQKSFMRLVLHHLNTPLATSKGSLELLEKAQPPETNAVNTIRPTILELATTIDYAAMEVINDSDNSLALSMNDTQKIGLRRIITRWYFLLPVFVAITSGVFINWILLQIGIETRAVYYIYQAIVAIMVALIFANALRLNRLTHKRREVAKSIQKAAAELEDKRLRIIRSLGTSLQSITLAIQTGAQQINNQQVRSLLDGSIAMLSRLSERMQILFAATSSPTAVSISAFVAEIIAHNQTAIEAKGITITSDIKVKPTTTIHANELSFILNSLVENAISFSKESGTVNISIIQNTKNIEAKITDTGEGIKQENIDQLFKPFSTSTDVLTYNHDGLGLSLYVDKQLLNKVDGKIAISSEPGKQTIATFSMPVV